MATLADKVRDIAQSKGLGNEALFNPMYSTSIDLLDYRIGKQNLELDKLQLGLPGGKEVLLIGTSGSAKTTLAIQMAWSIVKNYEQGIVIQDDFENATDLTRVAKVTGENIDDLKKRYIIRNENINAENMFSYVKELADEKIKNRKDYEVDMGTDKNGNPIKYLVPTVYIIDSLPSMYSKDIVSDMQITGQMDVTKQAKVNNQIIQRLIGSSTLQMGNIILIVINHIKTSISINPYNKPSKAVNYLKEGESLSGGTGMTYMASTLIKLTPGKSLAPDSDLYIKGFIDHCEIIKSRNAAAGTKFDLVYDQENGFSNPLTNLNMLIELKMLNGGRGPAKYYIEGYEDKKFSKKEFLSMYYSDKEFREIFDKYAQMVLVQLVPGGKLESTLNETVE